MFEKRQVRVAAGLLYGGTYGILLGGLYFALHFAQRKGYTEPEMVRIQVQHLMVGMMGGVLFGLIFGWKPRSLSAWIGSLGLGLLGTYGCFPVLRSVFRLEEPALSYAGALVAVASPFLGIGLGPLLERWVRSGEAKPTAAKSTEEPL